MRSDFFAVFQEQKRVDWVYPGDLISSGAACKLVCSRVLIMLMAVSIAKIEIEWSHFIRQ